jgi:hypothetical protein
MQAATWDMYGSKDLMCFSCHPVHVSSCFRLTWLDDTVLLRIVLLCSALWHILGRWVRPSPLLRWISVGVEVVASFLMSRLLMRGSAWETWPTWRHGGGLRRCVAITSPALPWELIEGGDYVSSSQTHLPLCDLLSILCSALQRSMANGKRPRSPSADEPRTSRPCLHALI